MVSEFDKAFMQALNEVSAKLFVEEQTEECVRKRIDRNDFAYAIRLLKDWFRRKPDDVETLRGLKAYLLEKRTAYRAENARYARTYRANRRAAREASDVRACVVCGAPLKGKRAGATTCSTKCRVAKSRGCLSSGDVRGAKGLSMLAL